MVSPYNSFDVFDTLIARRYVTSELIFIKLQEEFHIPNFARIREAADNGNRSIMEIYDYMNISYSVMQREIEIEHEHVVPIQENMDRVRDGDILISDMYMHPAEILSLVRAAGLKKQVSIFQSNAGKHNGTVWQNLKQRRPNLHLGDNIESDIKVPQSKGFQTEHTTLHSLSHNESYFLSIGLPNIAYLMREVRIRKPTDLNSEFHFIGSQLNLPWLLVFAELISRTSKLKKAFLGRDSQLSYYIYNSFYGLSYYIPFSRRVAFENASKAVSYLNSHSPHDVLFIDLCSTGATWEHLHGDLKVLVALYVDHFYYTPKQPQLTAGFSFLSKSSVCNHKNSIIELVNTADHGRLESIEQISNGIFLTDFSTELEVPKNIIGAIQCPIKTAARLSPVYKKTVRKELSQKSSEVLQNIFRQFISIISDQHHLESLVPAYRSHDERYIEVIKNYL